MTQEHFDDLFIKAKQKVLPQSKNAIIYSFSRYVKDIEHIQLDEVFTYLQMESITYTDKLIYSLLSEIVVDKK